MRRTAIALTTAALASAATAADFEGRAEYQLTDQRGQHGTAEALVGPGGARFHVEFSTPQMVQAGMPGIKATTIVKAGEKGRVYAVDDNARSYTVIETDPSEHDRGWKVTKLGSSSVAGYPCERARIESEGSRTAEVCIATTLGRVPFWTSSSSGRGSDGMPAALEKAGLNGLPIRWASNEGSGGEFVLELVKLKRESVPGSTFEVPAGYTKRGSGSSLSASDRRARMENAMKSLTPEQRKQVEKLLQGKGASSGD